MKVLGIQIKSNEAILVVLEQNDQGEVKQLAESTKFKLADHMNNVQVKQFRDQVNTAFDSIAPDKIGILVRNSKAKGRMSPSPVSFKLEGIIQLNDRYTISFVWPQSIASFLKKNELTLKPIKKFQEEAFGLAYYLIFN